MKYGLLILCTVLCLSGCSNKNSCNLHKQGTQQGINKIKRIAIITPVTHPSLEQIQQGFTETLSQAQNLQFTFSVFNANGNETLLRAQAEAIASNDHDLIFTIGAHATCIMKRALIKKHKKTPLVFGAVANPIKLGIVSSHQQDESFITGITEELDHQQQLDALFKFKPSIKKILLVYNPTQGAGLEDNKNTITKILHKKGIGLTCAEVYHTNEIQSKVTGLIEEHDALLVLKDNTVTPAIPCLAQLCSRYRVTLCASDLDSGNQGAVFSFGVNERDFGIESAKKALLILQEHKSPEQIPVTKLANYKVVFNTKTKEIL